MDYEICPSCGTEFEYQDALRTHEQLRKLWIDAGLTWHSLVIPRPPSWSPQLQLIEAGFDYELPGIPVSVYPNTVNSQGELRFSDFLRAIPA